MNTGEFAIRAPIFHTVGQPAKKIKFWEYFADGILVVANGRIQQLRSAQKIIRQVKAKMPVYEYQDCLICPGFVDTHVHYAQTRIIGSPASGLIEWLETHTFPEELKFRKEDYAEAVAIEFYEELLKNGTTCAQVYPTVHSASTDQLFVQAKNLDLRIIGGKVLMDCNAPNGLLDHDDYGIDQTESLIRRWHNVGRMSYSITLRFAGTSTEQQMQACGKLVQKYPDILFHTHLSETLHEIKWTLGLFPECSDYLEVYEKYGMVTDHSVFAHCIHLSDSECQRLSDSGASAALCPTSNLFLGSGLAQPKRLQDWKIPVSLGSDVGGGTSFSLLRTMHELYKVCQMGQESISVFELFYWATLGGACALHQDQHIGSFEPNKEADFIVLDAGKNNLLQHRMKHTDSIEEQLFAFVIMGDTQNIRETWSMGKQVYQRD